MIIEFVGYKGGGKTLAMVLFAYILHIMEGREILSNIWLSFDFEYLDAQKLVELDEEIINKVICIDEIHQYADSRRSSKKQNVYISYFFAQSRHTQNIVLYTTQFDKQADVRLRDNTDISVVCENLYYDSDDDGIDDTFHLIICDRRTGEFKEKDIYGKPIFDMYKTYERINIFEYLEKSKFLNFKEKNGKILIYNKKGEHLGEIIFYKRWKKYVTSFNGDTVYDDKCLVDIIRKLRYLQLKRKEKYK